MPQMMVDKIHNMTVDILSVHCSYECRQFGHTGKIKNMLLWIDVNTAEKLDISRPIR